MSDFEVLDTRIASALNKIIHNVHFKRISLEEQKAQKEDRFLRGRQVAKSYTIKSVSEFFHAAERKSSRTRSPSGRMSRWPRIILGRQHRLLHVQAPLAKQIGGEQEI